MLRQAAGPGVSIALDMAPDLARCRVDQAQFAAALLNLVINARDAMPGGGSVEISTADCTEAAGPFGLGRRSYVRVRVRDTGSGMPQQVRDRIFDPFFTTKGDRGPGLGLAQVLGGMRGIGGDARVSSKLGGGP